MKRVNMIFDFLVCACDKAPKQIYRNYHSLIEHLEHPVCNQNISQREIIEFPSKAFYQINVFLMFVRFWTTDTGI